MNDAPESLVVGADALRIEWSTARREIAAGVLRAACRCAECRSTALRGLPVAVPDSIRLTNAVPVGLYALQLRFSDGHERGIYPWSYLRSL